MSCETIEPTTSTAQYSHRWRDLLAAVEGDLESGASFAAKQRLLSSGFSDVEGLKAAAVQEETDQRTAALSEALAKRTEAETLLKEADGDVAKAEDIQKSVDRIRRLQATFDRSLATLPSKGQLEDQLKTLRQQIAECQVALCVSPDVDALQAAMARLLREYSQAQVLLTCEAEIAGALAQRRRDFDRELAGLDGEVAEQRLRDGIARSFRAAAKETS